jgi:hypothetical protein
MWLNYWQARCEPGVTESRAAACGSRPTPTACASTHQTGARAARSTVARARQRRLNGGGSSGNGEQTIDGLVPDGNPTVTLVMASRRRIDAPVSDNVYEATARGRIVAVIDRDATGRVVRHTLGWAGPCGHEIRGSRALRLSPARCGSACGCVARHLPPVGPVRPRRRSLPHPTPVQEQGSSAAQIVAYTSGVAREIFGRMDLHPV